MMTLEQIRADAAGRLAELGLPTTRDEEWRFTNVAPIARTEFVQAPAAADRGWRDRLPAVEGVRLVFLNGRYEPELSSKPPAGILAGCLRAANGSASRHLARYASYQQRAFVAANTARFDDGAFVEVPERLALSEPIHLVFLSAGADRPSVSYPRSLIVIGAGSQVTVVETYLGDGAGYLTNAVTELIAGDRSVVDHYKVQNEDESAFHVAAVQAEVGRDASYTTHSISLGGRLVRNDIGAVLSEGSETVMNGLYLAGGAQHVDHHTTLDHARPHAASRELYKGILGGRSTAVFNGRILVRPDAQKTDSKQSNKNLVLSEDATIHTKPELQIHADDVRCTHGATIGQLDADSLFYLQSRGIGSREAREMLIHAFAGEMLERVKPEPLRRQLERLIGERLHDHRRF
jgi:Fe-S cluster assembly protein SufD